MSISNESIYIIQLIAIIIAGGLIGEFYRSSKHSKTMSPKKFIANIFAGGFISFLIVYLYYYIFNDEQIAIILAGLLSYQKEETLTGFIKKILKRYLKQIKGVNEKKGDDDV